MDKLILIPLALGVAVAVAIIVIGFRRDTERKGIVARAVQWVRTRAAGGPGEPKP